jgi:hypothetical protein
VAGGDETECDQRQPGGDDVAAEAREAGQDCNADDDLDDAGHPHERAGGQRQDVQRERAGVLLPVREQVQELVETGQECGESEGDAQRPEDGIESGIHVDASSCIIGVALRIFVTLSPFSRGRTLTF